MQTPDDFQTHTPGLTPFFAVADGLAALHAPHMEAVVHDLATGCVAHIANPMSHRGAGDPSHLEGFAWDASSRVIGPYEKINWDGRRMKCVSIVLRDLEGAPLGLLCLNIDVSGLDAVRRALDLFLAPSAPQGDVASLFVADWHESVNRLVAAWTAERGLVLDRLDRAQRRALIAELQRKGAFEARRAPAYVARLLGISRATLYSELAALRAEAGEA